MVQGPELGAGVGQVGLHPGDFTAEELEVLFFGVLERLEGAHELVVGGRHDSAEDVVDLGPLDLDHQPQRRRRVGQLVQPVFQGSAPAMAAPA